MLISFLIYQLLIAMRQPTVLSAYQWKILNESVIYSPPLLKSTYLKDDAISSEALLTSCALIAS